MAGIRIGGQAVLQPPQGPPIWPVMVSNSTGWFIFNIGLGLDPFQVTTSQEVRTGITSAISDPRLSPDETETVYTYAADPAFGSNNQNIRVVQADDSGAREDIITDPIVPVSVQSGISCDWSPDGTMIAYSPLRAASSGTSSRGMVKRVNRDGTGATTLWTAAVNQRFVTYITYSPSGDYIAFAVARLGGETEVWVMEDDGTNPTNIAVTTGGGYLGGPAWQRGADVLAFFDLNQSGGTSDLYTCNQDGSGMTSILTDAANEYSRMGRLAWLSDDSALAVMKRTNGTTIMNATDWELATIDGSGGGR